MIILIPIGGKGDRFKNNGYIKPKALINILGIPMIFYLLNNLDINNIDFIYIPYNEEYVQYNFESLLIKKFPNINFKFFILDKDTDGAAETVNLALNRLTIEDCPILCLDSDNFYTINIIKKWNNENKIICFEDLKPNPIYSYIKIKEDLIIDIKEKEKITNYACTGAYGFKSYKELLKYSQNIINNNIRQKGEYYMSNVIKEMINMGNKFNYDLVNINDFHCLGTPIQIRQFCNNNILIEKLSENKIIPNLRICFDLDNTLVTFPKITGDYTSVKPLQKNINFLKSLKMRGHTIIIYTARRMKTYNNDIGKVLTNIGKITFNTLEKFDIPFDEIYFGKPYANMYIDDLGVNCYDNLEKTTGFYIDTIKPRDFNEFSNNIIETYTKKSTNLSGEIYYYMNIPLEIKDLFPLLLDYDVNNKYYTIEKINGLTATTLYVSELLTVNNLKYIMDSINRIQSIPIDTNIDININIYQKK